MPKPPEVVTGMRPPRSALMEQAAAKSAQAPVVPVSAPIPIEGTVYESHYLRYRVQIESGDDIKDSATGRRIAGKVFAVQFEDGRYVNAPKKHGKLDIERMQMIDEALQSNPRFGIGNHFWLAEAQAEIDRNTAVMAARATFKAIPPEMRERILAEMVENGELEIILPPRQRPNEVEPEV